MPSLHFDQIKQAIQILSKVGEGEDIYKYCETTPATILQEMEHFGLDNLVTETVKKTREKLKTQQDWEKWKASEFYQLDYTDKENMFGIPCRRPHGYIILRQVWTYVINKYGKRKSINTCDGSTLTGKGVQYTKKYVARASQHGFNIFIDLSIALVYIIMEADAINEYDY